MKRVNYTNGNRQINSAEKYVVAHVKQKKEKKKKNVKIRLTDFTSCCLNE